jgi:antitoxin (DNA-binding transcriptional repressor) of toxin-antitoxin stability system
MGMEWQLQQAKAKFSELVQKAIGEGPQTVTRHGKPTVRPHEQTADRPQGLDPERKQDRPRQTDL